MWNICTGPGPSPPMVWFVWPQPQPVPRLPAMVWSGTPPSPVVLGRLGIVTIASLATLWFDLG